MTDWTRRHICATMSINKTARVGCGSYPSATEYVKIVEVTEDLNDQLCRKLVEALVRLHGFSCYVDTTKNSVLALNEKPQISESTHFGGVRRSETTVVTVLAKC